MNEFTVDPNIVDPNDVSTLFMRMYPEAGIFGLSLVRTEEDGKLTFSSKFEINADELIKYMEENAATAKAEREDKLLQVECKVVKYKGDYYIIDGDTRKKIITE